MKKMTQCMIAAAIAWMALPAPAGAQTVDGAAVQAAAARFASGLAWRSASLLEADFSCSGKIEQAILGTSDQEIAVAIFTLGLNQPPSLVHFDASGRNIEASKIRVDDYNLTVDEIAGVTGETPVGYRPSSACHGVRVSDDSYEAAHIYWNHADRRFNTWSQ